MIVAGNPPGWAAHMSSFLAHCNSTPDCLLQPWQQVADVEAHIVHWITHQLQAGIKEVGLEKPAVTQTMWKCQQIVVMLHRDF